MSEQLVVGLVSISDRASTGIYEDKGIPALQEWLSSALTTPWRAETRLIADDQPTIEQALIELVDTVGCHLVLTTGGTGPARRDVTPEATLAVADKEMPGFGEEMRRISLNFVPTAILSRQVAVIRNFTANDDERHEHIGALQMHQNKQGGAHQKLVSDRIQKRTKRRGLVELAGQKSVQPIGGGKHHEQNGSNGVAHGHGQRQVEHPNN
jgi:molybdenum cofactor synthesis domain-containing protein